MHNLSPAQAHTTLLRRSSSVSNGPRDNACMRVQKWIEKFPAAASRGRVRRLLADLLLALVRWSPACGEAATFVPGVAYPLAKLFGTDKVSAFECTATVTATLTHACPYTTPQPSPSPCRQVLLNWCRRWFSALPFPPLDTLQVSTSE